MREEIVKIHSTGALMNTERVRMARIDSLRDECRFRGEKVLLKIDTQGFELEVLKGASEALRNIGAVEVEISLIPLYEGQPIYVDVCSMLENHGFHLVWIERGWVHPVSNNLLQMDALFTNDDLFSLCA